MPQTYPRKINSVIMRAIKQNGTCLSLQKHIKIKEALNPASLFPYYALEPSQWTFPF
jgi:hypothetical protein